MPATLADLDPYRIAPWLTDENRASVMRLVHAYKTHCTVGELRQVLDTAAQLMLVLLVQKRWERDGFPSDRHRNPGHPSHEKGDRR